MRHQKHAKSLMRLFRDELSEVKRGVEIGICMGPTSISLFRVFPHLRLTMVDDYLPYKPTVETPVQQLVALMTAKTNTDEFANRREFLLCNSKTAAGLYPDETFDFAFIDANHSYRHVRQDIQLWLPKIKKGGLLTGHDIDGMGDHQGYFGVRKAVDEAFGKDIVGVLPGHVWWIKKDGSES